jgi:hypothetical protein
MITDNQLLEQNPPATGKMGWESIGFIRGKSVCICG